MHDVQFRHGLALCEPRADRDVVNGRVARVLFGQNRFVGMVQRHHGRRFHELRERDPDDVVEVNQIG